MAFTESIIEQAALDWLASLGYACAFGPDLAFDGPAPERPDYHLRSSRATTTTPGPTPTRTRPSTTGCWSR